MNSNQAWNLKAIMPDVSILILNWNGKTDTIACLQSLRTLHYANVEIVLVDNGSSDHSAEDIHQQFPQVTLLQNTENLGFVGGNNQGIRYALSRGSEYLLLLNNDTLVDPDFLSSLMRTAEKYPDIGMLNPIIYYSNSTNIWFCGGKINWENGVTSHLMDLDRAYYLPEYDHSILSEYATGCALLTRSEVIRQIGLLDPRFFAYYEDTDWSVRCQKAGWKTVVVPTAKIWHKVSATASPRQAFIWGHRNLILFLWKHSSMWEFPFRFRRAVYKCLHEFTWHREQVLGEAALHGLWSAVTLHFGKTHREMPSWLMHWIRRHLRYVLRVFR